VYRFQSYDYVAKLCTGLRAMIMWGSCLQISELSLSRHVVYKFQIYIYVGKM
jgi:hypothetical protein